MTNLKKTKVLYLITKSNWGGAQRYVFDLATSLPADSYEVCVACGGDGEMRKKLLANGVRVVTIESLERNISLKKELLAFREISKIVREEMPDILHVNSSKAGIVGTLIGRIKRVPKVIFTSHGWAFNEDRGFISRFFHQNFALVHRSSFS